MLTVHNNFLIYLVCALIIFRAKVQDLACLQRRVYVNDNVIRAYMKVMEEAITDEGENEYWLVQLPVKPASD